MHYQMGNIVQKAKQVCGCRTAPTIILDTLTKQELINHLKNMTVKKLALDEDLTRILTDADMELSNKELIPMYMELYEELSSILSEYKPTKKVGNDSIMKKILFIKPEFKSNDVYKQHNELVIEVATNSLAAFTTDGQVDVSTSGNTGFKTGFIDMTEFNDAFNDPTIKCDMFGVSKLLLRLLPQYLKLRFINAFNKVYINHSNFDMAVGKVTFAYKEAKNGAKTEMSSFRPIMSIPNIVSHFHRILYLRLEKYISSNNFIDTNIQKGGVSGQKSAILQQLYKLKSTITDANKHNKKCAVLFLDITNAFGSLSRNGLYNILRHYKVDEEFINYLKGFYDNYQYYVNSGANLTTDLMSFPTGLIQGCPMSPLLFIFALNYVLSNINNKFGATHSYTYNDAITRMLLLAFIDDICITCKDLDSLTQVYTELRDTMKQLGLELNHSKSGIMLIGYSEDEVKEYKLDDIPKIESYKYLGEYVSRDGKINTSYTRFINVLGRKLNVLDAKEIDNKVKLDVFSKFFKPFITRRLAMMYDLDKHRKVKIFSLIKKFNVKWGNNEKLAIFPAIDILLENSDDVVIENIKKTNPALIDTADTVDDYNEEYDEYRKKMTIDDIDEEVQRDLARGVKISYGDSGKLAYE
jgi:hypothetical protein